MSTYETTVQEKKAYSSHSKTSTRTTTTTANITMATYTSSGELVTRKGVQMKNGLMSFGGMIARGKEHASIQRRD
jgi:hypothetical protein